jgi:outer membrane cobalamin receptor
MVNLQGSVDFQDPRDTDKDLQLARRSKRYANLSADTTLAGWRLGAEMQAGKRFDDAANKTVLGGYTLWNLSAQKQLSVNGAWWRASTIWLTSAMSWPEPMPPKAAAAISVKWEAR